MGKRSVLSSQFNMSTGYIPVIISILLCEYAKHDIAIYLGAGVGLLMSLYIRYYKKVYIPQIILYGITGMLMLFTLAIIFIPGYCPKTMLPFTLEISAFIPVYILYLNRKWLRNYRTSQSRICAQYYFSQGIESAIVSAKVLLIIGAIHLLVILCAVIISHPLSETTTTVLFHIVPPCVFILSILFNQYGIYYFNKVMAHTLFVPIVNKKGDVIGKALASDALKHKNEYINPVIRIAVVYHGLLFLHPRPKSAVIDKGKTDLLLESYLIFGENLEQGIDRILHYMLPSVPRQNVHFSFMYHFENEVTNRMVYLFLLDLDDDKIICNKELQDGKLWTFQQIEHNLHRNFFSSCFEYEYEHLKSVINTREKYKVIGN